MTESNPMTAAEDFLDLVDAVRSRFGELRVRLEVGGVFGALRVPAHPSYQVPKISPVHTSAQKPKPVRRHR
jgi:hypothetical protein